MASLGGAKSPSRGEVQTCKGGVLLFTNNYIGQRHKVTLFKNT